MILYNALLKAAGKVYDTVEMERILAMMAEQVLYSVRNHARLRFAYIFYMFMRAGCAPVLGHIQYLAAHLRRAQAVPPLSLRSIFAVSLLIDRYSVC